MISQKISHDFHRAMQTWFHSHGRDLPWRRMRDPYAVLVSEFMLQQTTVAAVIPYFERWMQNFPSVAALAEAEEQEVLRIWQGLGYYSRARHLHQTARRIMQFYQGSIPQDIAVLRKLPGIGPYTASAIAAFAFDKCVPVLDANISRVVARLFNYRLPIATAVGRKFLERAASALLPDIGGHVHTSALMDLGASVCRSGEPRCSVCPVRAYCKALEPSAIPIRSPRASILLETELRVFARRHNKIFLIPSPGPRWKGLWILPKGNHHGEPLAIIHYTLTRHRIRLEVVRARPQKGWIAFPQNALPPMPTPHLSALEKILSLQK